jgi:hypothetical protein
MQGYAFWSSQLWLACARDAARIVLNADHPFLDSKGFGRVVIHFI